MQESLALRIGLAARCLPETDPKRLIEVLADWAGGQPLTEALLGRLSPAELKLAAGGEFKEAPMQALMQAVDCLQGDEVDAGDPLPQVAPYEEGDMPGSLRVAIASNTGDSADGHFGSCARFLIYQVSATAERLVEIRPALKPDNAEKEWRAELIADCDIVFIASIGGPQAARINRHRIHPIKVQPGRPASEHLNALKVALGQQPPPWLKKLMAA